MRCDQLDAQSKDSHPGQQTAWSIERQRRRINSVGTLAECRNALLQESGSFPPQYKHGHDGNDHA